MLGMMIGLLQWLFLRQQAVHSSIWLLSSVLGAGLSVTLVIETDLINSSGVLAYMAGVLIYVVATGLTLAMLISGKHSSQSTITNTD